MKKAGQFARLAETRTKVTEAGCLISPNVAMTSNPTAGRGMAQKKATTDDNERAEIIRKEL